MRRLPGGSAEILLRIALSEAASAGAEAGLVRLDDLTLPARPAPPGRDGAGREGAAPDHGPWLWDQFMDCDGLLVATPIYPDHPRRAQAGRRPAGRAADVAFAESYRAMLAAGQDPPVRFPYDERVFRPRVAGFIAVGGARAAQWQSLALPLLHQITFSAHIAVVDQLLAGGAGLPRSVVLDAGRWPRRPGRPERRDAAGNSLRCGGVSRRARPVPAVPPFPGND